MKLIKWEFNGLIVPMIDIEGDLYCTSKAICSALGVTDNALKQCYRDHGIEIGESLGCLKEPLRSFLYENKIQLDIKRVRTDINIWSEDQMLTFAFHITSDKAIQFRKDLIVMIKQYAKKDTISRDEYEKLQNEFQDLKHTVGVLVQSIESAQIPMSKIASESGKLLRIHRDVKAFRTSKPIGVA